MASEDSSSRPLIAVDRGGTFTDAIAWSGSGEMLGSQKISSSDTSIEDVVELLLTRLRLPHQFDLRVGTTLATNALLSNEGARCAMLVTKGFEDLFEIDTQARDDLFDLRALRRRPHVECVLAIDERISSDGAAIQTPNVAELAIRLRRLRAGGIHSLGVCLVHANIHPAHELAIEKAARKAGFDDIYLSHRTSVERGHTARAWATWLDASLSPILRERLTRLESRFPEARCLAIRSDSMLVAPSELRGSMAVLSGPAGGAAALQAIANHLNQPVFGFDMGGTSTDVCRAAPGEELSVLDTLSVQGGTYRVAALDIKTVAAGGGSICTAAHGRLQVGPASVGADPGPLFYGNDGSSAVALSDIALASGRLPFTRGAEEAWLEANPPIRIFPKRTEEGVAHLAQQAGLSTDATISAFLRIAIQEMASAVQDVASRRGLDIREHALVCLGGASGQYICDVAAALGVDTILEHPQTSVLSALGIGLAGEVERRVSGLQGRLRDFVPEALSTEARHWLGLRAHRGTSSFWIPVERSSTDVEIQAAFDEEHRHVMGFSPEGEPELIGLRSDLEEAERIRNATQELEPRTESAARTQPVLIDEAWHEARLIPRSSLRVRESVEGPALILSVGTTLYVSPDFTATMDDAGQITLRRSKKKRAKASGDTKVETELFARRLRAIASEMGVALQRAARSPNIRDRLDFSCAIFDAKGDLLANAPHIPVHLGSMGACVKALLPDLLRAPGECFLTNSPSRGGTHLPDITVVQSVADRDGEIWAFVAARGHHADVGGSTPGSMPSRAFSLEEEGLCIDALQLTAGEQFLRTDIRRVLKSGPYPVRDLETNLIDLQAQVAACRRGAVRLRDEFWTNEPRGADHFQRRSKDLQKLASDCVERALREVGDGAYHTRVATDWGSEIAVRWELQDGRARLSFSGTSGAHPENLNATKAVTEASVLYALRLMSDAPVPLCQGCLTPVRIEIPDPSLLSPPSDSAVSLGNVETSQRVVDALLLSLGIAASSQGTMNNVSVGGKGFSYYETVAGGAGGCQKGAGGSAVHSHMTNSRITDVEILESHYPVRVVEFRVRRGSGGAGRFAGGDGLVRVLEALAPMRVELSAGGRIHGREGLCGGEPGAPGAQRVLRRDGEWESVGGRCAFELAPGDRFELRTPGGGGYAE